MGIPNYLWLADVIPCLVKFSKLLYDVCNGCVALLLHYSYTSLLLEHELCFCEGTEKWLLHSFILKRKYTHKKEKRMFWPALSTCIIAVCSRWECQCWDFVQLSFHQSDCSSKIFQAWQMGFTWTYWVITQNPNDNVIKRETTHRSS